MERFWEMIGMIVYDEVLDDLYLPHMCLLRER